MNSEIEQRIVAMYFDNKDFEKNAKQTIDTLGELKDSLNLEQSVKGFDELDKAGKKLNLNQARTTIKNMKESLSGMEGALKKAFDIGTAPLHALDNFFGTFRSYVGKFLGFDLASKFVGSLESAIRQLTIAPVEAGWNMYQQNIDSTKTIMTGTLKSYKEQMSKHNTDWTYNEEKHMEYVKGQLDELSRYAQQTVFSLSDMTSNVGKFTNNNIDLETSVTAMEGIANMTAKAGQGAQQASMAMYNFSQALGVGKMTSIDWKSIENANLATTELKQLFIDTAVAGGKLKKEVTKLADGTEINKFFATVDKNGKQLAKKNWIEISAENFRDSLSNGWLDKETMLRVFQIYSNQVKDLDTLKAWGFDVKDTQLVEYLFGIGESADAAAKEVRTFKKMWDALTESVQSGWADSMQYIFGDMREATVFWTDINTRIGDVFDAASEKRNNVLKEWRGLSFDEETKEWKKLDGAVDGREDLVQGIYGTIDALKAIGSAFRDTWSGVFGDITGKKLQEITAGFRSLVERFREWLGSTEDENSRLSKLMTGIRGVLNVVKLVGTAIKTLINVGVKIVKPFIDPLINMFEQIGKFADLGTAKNLGEMLKLLRDRFSGLFKELKDLGFSGIMIKIGDTLKDIGIKIRDGLHEFLDGAGLGDVYDWFVQLGDNLKAGYEKVKTWWESSGIPEFFQGIWDALVGVFKPKLTGVTYDSTGRHESYGNSPFAQFFVDTWEGIKNAFEEIKGWGIWSTIGTFFSTLWQKLSGIFTPKLTGIYYDSTGRHETYGPSPFAQFFIDTWEGIKNAFEVVRGWGIWGTIGTFFSGVWNSLAGIFTPKLTGIYYDSTGRHETYGPSPFAQFFIDTWEGIKNAFENVKSWDIWSTIGRFFSGVWDSLAGIFTPKLTGIYYDSTGRHESYGPSPFVQFFVDTWEGVKKAYEDIKGWSIWGTIGSFFSGIWETITSVFTPVTITGKMGNTWTEDPPIVKFFNDAWEGIKNVYEEVIGWPIWGQIKDFFTDVFSSIGSFFEGFGQTGDAVSEASNTISQISNETAPTEDSVSVFERIITAISGFFTTIIEKVSGVVIPPEINTFFVNLGDILKTIVGVIGEILGHVNNMLKGEGSFGEWGTAVALFIAILADKVFNYKNNKFLSTINGESIASKFMSLGVGLLAISAAIALLTTIDQGKMWIAVGAVTVIGTVVGAIVGQLAKNTKNQQGLAAINQKTEIWTKLIGAVEKIGLVAVAMSLLPGIIKSFADAKKAVPELTGGDIFAVLSALTTFLVGISVGLALVTRISGSGGISPLAAIKTAISVVGVIAVVLTGFTAIIGMIGGISELIGGGDLDEIIKTINDGAAVIAAVGGAIGGFFAALFGGGTPTQKAEEAKRQMESLAEASEIFDTEKVSGISRMMTLVQSLSRQGETIDPSKLNGFSEAMSKLGSGIYEYTRFLTGEDYMQALSDLSDPTSAIYTRLMAFQSLGTKLSELFAGWGNAGWSMTTAFDRLKSLADEKDPLSIQQLVAYLNKIMRGLGDLEQPDTGIQFDGLTIVTKLYNAIQEGLVDPKLPSFDATPIVDSIIKAINLGESAIALAVHAMVQAGMNGAERAGGNSGYSFTPEEILGFMTDPNSTQNGIESLTGQYEEMLYGKGGTADNPASDSLFGVFSGLSSNLDEIEIPDMSAKLKDAFSFKDPETGEALDLTADLRKTLDTFQEELNNGPAFEITIVPTFDFKNLNTLALQAALKDYPIGMPLDLNIPDAVQLGSTGMNLNMSIEGIKTKIDNVAAAVTEGQRNIVVAVQSMENRIGQMTSAIYNLKLYLDTGALVGGITPALDRELGRRASLSEVTGVSPTIAQYNTLYR